MSQVTESSTLLTKSVVGIESPGPCEIELSQVTPTEFVIQKPLGGASLKPPGIPRAAKTCRRPPLLDTTIPTRRSSTRSIKRKKFDDELVESSLVKSDRGRLKAFPVPFPPTVTHVPAAGTNVNGTDSEEPPPSVVSEITTPGPPVTLPPPPSLPPPEKKVKVAEKRVPKSSSRRARRQKAPAPASTKDLGRWKAQDDLALITAATQTNDLTAVHLGVKFSCHFNLKEIQERWYALLYDPIISKLAVQSMKQLNLDVVSSVQARTLYSKAEESLLGKIASSSAPTLEMFEELLTSNPQVFHPMRTAKALLTHWQLMKQYHLLPDQSVQPLPRGDHILNFSDAEDVLNDDELKDARDEALEHELAIADRRNKREIRHLENELPKWQVLVDSVTGISPPDFDNQTLAVLRGRLVRYLMRSKEISLGRATADNMIDVDLALEGPAWKISRRQGIIKLRNNGDFFIANEGKRPIFIDGKPVLAGNKHKLCNNSVVEISCLRFIFLINQDLINVIKQESQKTSTVAGPS